MTLRTAAIFSLVSSLWLGLLSNADQLSAGLREGIFAGDGCVVVVTQASAFNPRFSVYNIQLVNAPGRLSNGWDLSNIDSSGDISSTDPILSPLNFLVGSYGSLGDKYPNLVLESGPGFCSQLIHDNGLKDWRSKTPFRSDLTLPPAI